MATHSTALAWRIPGTGKPDGLLSMGSHRVRHDWSDLAAASAKAAKVSFTGWTDNLWCTHTMEYYSKPKINELSNHERTQKNLRWILVSERSQSEKATNCMIPPITVFKKQTLRDSKKITYCQESGKRERWISEEQRIFKAVKLPRTIV